MMRDNIFFSNDIQETILDIKPKEAFDFFKELVPDIINFGKLLAISLIILFIGRKLIKFITKFIKKSFQKANLEKSVANFLVSMIRTILHILLIIVVISMVGIPTTSFVALIGSAGLAVGLSLQGSLSNFAGGVLILLLHPFKIGDYIVEGSGKNEGVVKSIDIFYTKLLTNDNKTIIIPNGALSNASIINVNDASTRRLDIDVVVSYSEDVNKVKLILNDIASKHELTLKDKDIFVFINNFGKNTVEFGLRLWVNTDSYWELKCDLLEKIKKSLDENNIVVC